MSYSKTRRPTKAVAPVLVDLASTSRNYRSLDGLHAEIVPGVSIRLFGTIKAGSKPVVGAMRPHVYVRPVAGAVNAWVLGLRRADADSLASLIASYREGGEVTTGIVADWMEDNGCQSMDVVRGYFASNQMDAYTLSLHPAYEPVYADVDRTFRIGDQAEYKSYNLSYFGPIEAIGPKTVTVGNGYAFDPSASRLKTVDFAERNWDFDLDRSEKRNREWMD